MKANKNTLSYLSFLLLILIIFSLIIIILPKNLNLIENSIYDFLNQTYIRLFTKEKKELNLDFLFIEIDSETLKKLNSIIVDKKIFAELNGLLNKCNPSLIFYDYIFTTKTSSDKIFIESIKDSPYLFPCAMIFKEISELSIVDQPVIDFMDKNTKNMKNNENQNFYSGEYFTFSVKDIMNKSKGIAHINAVSDDDGVFRSIPLFVKYKDKYIPSVSLYFTLTILDKSLDDISIKKNKIIINDNSKSIIIPVNDNGEMLVNFTLDSKIEFSKISYLKIIQIAKEDINMLYDLIEDKIVIITDTSFASYDYGKTPIAINFLKSLLHSFSVKTIISKEFVRTYPLNFNIIILIILSIIIVISTIRLSALKFSFLNISLLIIYIIISLFLFYQFTIYLSIFIFVSFFVIAIIGILILKYIFEEKEKSFIRYAFNFYLPKTVVNQILKNRDQLKLEGKSANVTIIFSDITNFTSLSEIITPIEIVKFLNYYNTEMANIIKDNNGIIDKYLGDAIMAEFGLPIEIADNEKISANNACKCAIEMQKRLEIIKQEYTSIDVKNLGVKIGINSGQVIAGNMGSAELFDYTVIGDEVNLASRLEGANKFYKTKIIIGENTNELIKENFFTRTVDLLRVKGRKTPEKVFELIEFKNPDTLKIYKDFLEYYNNAFQCYTERDYTKAIAFLNKAKSLMPDDEISKQLEIKCKDFIKKPPPEDWDGVTILESK